MEEANLIGLDESSLPCVEFVLLLCAALILWPFRHYVRYKTVVVTTGVVNESQSSRSDESELESTSLFEIRNVFTSFLGNRPSINIPLSSERGSGRDGHRRGPINGNWISIIHLMRNCRERSGLEADSIAGWMGGRIQ